jgi:glycosyltransferase involved in cell wall biosynthesis
LLHQIKIVLALLKQIIRSKVDIVIFAHGADLSALPILLCRLTGKKVILRSDGRPSLVHIDYFKRSNRRAIVAGAKIQIYRIVEAISYSLANKIALEYSYMVDRYNLHKYSNKLSAASQYVDTNTFYETKKLTERKYTLGYVGRFSKEKGVIEFINALPLILKDTPYRALVIGDGDLREEIKDLLTKNSIQRRVELLDWVEPKKLRRYLNNLKMLVLPSYHEGMPRILLEAMACGTPVLATPIGGIPEVIKDHKTGFIMENNTSNSIAEKAKQVLEYPALEKIAINAGKLVRSDYAYETALENYKTILASLWRNASW